MPKSMEKGTLIGVLILFILSMTVMIRFMGHQTMVLTNVVQEQSSFNENGIEEMNNGNQLLFDEQKENPEETILHVPLADGILADQIVIENHYMEQELWIYITGTDSNFYQKERLTGSMAHVISGEFNEIKDTTLLKIRLDDVLECSNKWVANDLQLVFTNPGTLYDKIIVVDPMYGGKEAGYTADDLTAKDLTLEITSKLKERLDATDIKVYYTRSDNSDPTGEARIELANMLGADMYIGIDASWSEEDSKECGIEALCQSHYFVPELNSVELAVLLENNVVASVEGIAKGLIEADEEHYQVWNAKVPAATIRVGYMSNQAELMLLERDDYREKIADGIYQAIMEAYEQGD